jgi:hypothetical protein
MTEIHAKHVKNRHRSQLAKRNSARTRREGCTWTTGSNGIAAATGNRKRPSPDTVLAQVPRSHETNPETPGWSLPDLDLACNKLGVDLLIDSGWDMLRGWRNKGFGIALQGDSDVFTAGCMGIFDGDHCIYIHPDESDGKWRVDDPMCPTATHREPEKLREYAQKLADARFGGVIRFGVFRPAVPLKK